MEAPVKATRYGGLCRTNSADVKNIAYDEQSDCHSDRGLPGWKNGKSRLTWWKHAHNDALSHNDLIPFKRNQTAS